MYIEPPRALTEKEFKQALKQGKKTLFEIDPALHEYVKMNNRMVKANVIILLIGCVLVLALPLLSHILVVRGILP